MPSIMGHYVEDFNTDVYFNLNIIGGGGGIKLIKKQTVKLDWGCKLKIKEQTVQHWGIIFIFFQWSRTVKC
ncbi:hypothetical protein FKM82_012827 [Ascaphus truei]